MMHPRTVVCLCAPLAALAAASGMRAGVQPAAAGPRVEISFAASARQEPVTGMVYFAISRDNRLTPIRQHDTTGVPLVADKTIPAIAPTADTDLVKRIKIQSQILTKWWGQPIFLGATILLPKDYDKHPDVRYPVNYIQGHFSLDAPAAFGRALGQA